MNVTMRPAAGIVGLVAHPFKGVWKSAQSVTARAQEQQQRNTRVSDGLEEVKLYSQAQRADIVKKFRDLKPGTKERQRQYKDLAEEVMYGNKTKSPAESTLPSSSSGPASAAPLAPGTEPSSTPAPVDEDAAFERDLELAKQLSLAEQRGYERGLAGLGQT